MKVYESVSKKTKTKDEKREERRERGMRKMVCMRG